MIQPPYGTGVVPSTEDTIQFLHIFETDILSGGHGNRIETKYIHPLRYIYKGL